MVIRERNTFIASSAGLALVALSLAACSATDDGSQADSLGVDATPSSTTTATQSSTTSATGATTTAPATSPTPTVPTQPVMTPGTMTPPTMTSTTTPPTMTSVTTPPTSPSVEPTAPDASETSTPALPTDPASTGAMGTGGSDEPGDDMTPMDDPPDMTDDDPMQGAGGGDSTDPGDDMTMPDKPDDMPADDGTEYGGGGARKLGYLGCSMSQNVAEGYATLGGEHLWPVMGAYGAQVVQNWTSDGGSPWSGSGSFDSAVQEYGNPDAVWIMLCIFSNMVTIDESKKIVDLVRKHAPDAKIYITGQPLNSGTSCFLAGDGGDVLTDKIAQETPMQPGYEDVIYAGTFGPLSPEQRSDGCHANADGMRLLGEQVIEKWGK